MDSVVHFEVPFDDKERAETFYSTVFDWKLKGWPMGDGNDYTIAYTCEIDEADDNMPKEKGKINGGMTPRTPQGEGCMIVMNVKNLDETMEKVKGNGGEQVMPKMKVGEMGWYARAKDSEGNVIGVWEDIPKK